MFGEVVADEAIYTDVRRHSNPAPSPPGTNLGTVTRVLAYCVEVESSHNSLN